MDGWRHGVCLLMHPPKKEKKKSNGLMQMIHTCTQPVWGKREALVALTLEEALDTQVADAQAQYGQLVQFGDDVGGEGQQAGQPIQLCVQSVTVSLGRVGLLVGRDWFPVKAVHRGQK